MVYEAVKEKDDDAVVEKDLALNQGEMLLLAIATSIDALESESCLHLPMTA